MLARGIIGTLGGIALIGGAWLFSRRLSAEIDAVFGFPFGDVPMVHEDLAVTRPNLGGWEKATSGNGLTDDVRTRHGEGF